jgi:hypothetical protein
MSSLEPYYPNLPLTASPLDVFGSRVNRQARRGLAAVDANTVVRRAHIDAEADLVKEKIDAIAGVGGYALQRAALVNQMQQQLALACPAASGDLDFIKSLTMMGIGQTVTDAARIVGRQ